MIKCRMNKKLPPGRISIRMLLVSVMALMLTGCANSPDMVRKFSGTRDTQLIAAKRPLVAACISQQLKTVSFYDVYESAASVQLREGGQTLRIYDLEDWIGGTMVITYVGSPIFISAIRSVVDDCRRKLESPPPPQPARAK